MQNPRFRKGFRHNGYTKTAISTLILAAPVIHEDCTLSSLERLSLECELHPLTATLLEARIKIQRCLLTLLLPAEPSTIRDAGSTIRDVGSTIRDAGSTIRDANARSVLALTKIWRSLLARQLIVG